MARAKAVTRSIVTTTANVIVVDTNTATIDKVDVVLNGKHDNKSALKAAKKKIESDDIKVVKIQSLTPESKLYSMSEEKFIASAECIGEGRK